MPAKSKAQHGLMGMVLDYKSGKLKAADIPPRVKSRVVRMAKEMTSEQVEEFTSTPSKNLPEHKGQGRHIRNVKTA
jgi:hypothetical protein